jgi:hypothetical protein
MSTKWVDRIVACPRHRRPRSNTVRSCASIQRNNFKRRRAWSRTGCGRHAHAPGPGARCDRTGLAWLHALYEKSLRRIPKTIVPDPIQVAVLAGGEPGLVGGSRSFLAVVDGFSRMLVAGPVPPRAESTPDFEILGGTPRIGQIFSGTTGNQSPEFPCP